MKAQILTACVLVAACLIGAYQAAPMAPELAAETESRPVESAAAEPAAPAEGWGTLKGRVVFGGDQIPESPVIVKKGDATVKDSAVCAGENILSEELVVNKENKGIRWAVLYITGKPAVHPDLKEVRGTVELGQRNCSFRPRVVLLRQGQKLLFTSDDPVAHNTKGDPFRNPGFNPIIPPAPKDGRSELAGPDLVAEPRPFPISCSIHPWMKSWIGVFNHPYFAVTDEKGSFEIRNVPAGTQNLVVWQESIGYGEGKGKGKEIAVKADETTDLGEIPLKK